MSEHYDLVVIGAGPAGEKGAAQAAYFGKRVCIVERGPKPGGAAVNTSTIPSKTLRETALYFSGLRQRGLYGVDYKVKSDITIGDFMLPHIFGRPVSLVRSPSGRLDDIFFQRHPFMGMPATMGSFHHRGKAAVQLGEDGFRGQEEQCAFRGFPGQDVFSGHVGDMFLHVGNEGAAGKRACGVIGRAGEGAIAFQRELRIHGDRARRIGQAQQAVGARAGR